MQMNLRFNDLSRFPICHIQLLSNKMLNEPEISLMFFIIFQEMRLKTIKSSNRVCICWYSKVPVFNSLSVMCKILSWGMGEEGGH